VTRALEGAAAANGGSLESGAGVTDLILDASFEPRIVDGLLTGMHEPTESHYRLLEAFVERAVLDRAITHAIEVGYRTHEFGDCTLVLTA
jgi:S-adenosylmethionine:tRNA ribosyltransferase-isomerase